MNAATPFGLNPGTAVPAGAITPQIRTPRGRQSLRNLDLASFFGTFFAILGSAVYLLCLARYESKTRQCGSSECAARSASDSGGCIPSTWSVSDALDALRSLPWALYSSTDTAWRLETASL